MKTLTTFSISLLLVLVACGPKKDPNLTYFETSTEYNDYIIDEQNAIFDQVDALFAALETFDTSQISKSYTLCKSRSQEAVTKMEKLADFKGNTEFRDKAKALFSYIQTSCDKEFKTIVDIFKKDILEVNEADIDVVDTNEQKYRLEEERLNNEMIDAQKKFAKEFDLILI